MVCSGSSLDALCQPFAPVIRELKAQPPTLIGEDWDSLEGKVAKVLLADQLSRSCFRGTAEAFSYDQIGKKLVRGRCGLDRRNIETSGSSFVFITMGLGIQKI